jgi:hypothetical protein
MANMINGLRFFNAILRRGEEAESGFSKLLIKGEDARTAQFPHNNK